MYLTPEREDAACGRKGLVSHKSNEFYIGLKKQGLSK